MPAWTPPTKAAQRAAMSSQTVPKDLAPWLRPEIYPAIAEPDEDDWPRGSGQSFEKYVASKPRRPIGNGGGASNNRSAPLRNKIYLQPLGDTLALSMGLEFTPLVTVGNMCLILIVNPIYAAGVRLLPPVEAGWCGAAWAPKSTASTCSRRRPASGSFSKSSGTAWCCTDDADPVPSVLSPCPLVPEAGAAPDASPPLPLGCVWDTGWASDA